MKCPEEIVLSDLVDGTLNEKTAKELIQHVKECPSCKEKMEALVLFEQQLDTFWTKSRKEECPGAELLQAYRESSLSREEHARLDEHIQKCKFCQLALEDVAAVEEALDSLPESALEKARPYAVLHAAESACRSFVGSSKKDTRKYFEPVWERLAAWFRMTNPQVSEDWSTVLPPKPSFALAGFQPGKVPRPVLTLFRTLAVILATVNQATLAKREFTAKEIEDIVHTFSKSLQLSKQESESVIKHLTASLPTDNRQ